jgi:ubiquinone/menaquinone biosynthesis C-methylase UbiE
MREHTFRGVLLEQALAAAPSVVLDLGCGTGTLAIQLAHAIPLARVIGLDGDPGALRRAAEKAHAAGAEIELIEAFATAIPLPDRSVDCVTCSLVLHHLSPTAKACALEEAHRVLRPRGVLLIADWGAAHDPLMRVAFLAVQLLDGFQNTRAHAEGEVPGLIARSGFTVTPLDRLRTAWGSLELFTCTASQRDQSERAA